MASTLQGTGSAPLSPVTTCPPAWKDCHVVIPGKERILPCVGTPFALRKVLGYAADFGTFSLSDGLWDPKSNEKRLAMKRGGKWSRFTITEGWSRFEE